MERLDLGFSSGLTREEELAELRQIKENGAENEKLRAENLLASAEKGTPPDDEDLKLIIKSWSFAKQPAMALYSSQIHARASQSSAGKASVKPKKSKEELIRETLSYKMNTRSHHGPGGSRRIAS